jgi:iron complex outermembrane recepter protein
MTKLRNKLLAAALCTLGALNAAAQTSYEFNLPQQPLADALRAIGSQTATNILFEPATVENLTAPAVRGLLSPAEAIKRVLAGTKLVVEQTAANSLLISRVQSTSTAAPPALLRLAQVESPQKPVRAAQSGETSAEQSPQGTVINEVIVTARKREERASDIPATVQVLDQTQLAQRGVSDMADLQRTIPNFVYSTGRPFESQVKMRGIGTPTLNVPGVGLYIDGAYQVDPAAFALPFYDVERIEVLKGPQGTLYGRNSMAGAINYITRAPSNHFEGDLSAEVGSGETYKAGLSLAGPLLGSEILSGRITAAMQRQNGFRDFLDGTDADFDDYDGVNARLALRPSDVFSADLKFSYVRRTAGAYLYRSVSNLNDDDGRLLTTAPFTNGVYAGQHQRGDNKSRAATLRLTYSASPFDVIATSTYDKSEVFSLVDIDDQPLDLTNSANFFQRDSFSQELRLNSKGTGPLTWLVGAYYTEGTSPVATFRGTYVQLATGAPRFLAIGDGNFDGYAVFSDAEYALSEQWVVGAGIRYDSIDKSQVNPTTGATLSDTFTSTQPKVSLKYRFSPSGQVYVTVAKGFREGGFNASLAGTALENYPLEELWSYEAGVKSTFANGKGYVELAAFYIDIDAFNGGALVVNPTTNLLQQATVPIGAVESKGVELSTSYKFSNSFTIDLSGGYNVAQPTELSPATQPGQAIVDEQLTNAPLWNIQLTPKLDIPLNNEMTLGLLASLSRVGPTNFSGGASGTTTLLLERNPYSVLDARASLEWRNYTVTAFVKNATDEIYPTSYLALASIVSFGGTTPAAIYNQPRYYGVSFRAKF